MPSMLPTPPPNNFLTNMKRKSIISEFVSIHDVNCSDDMRRIDLVYATVKTINKMTGSNWTVNLVYTDGVNIVNAKSEDARFVETFIGE